jgi:hypothetical protein
MLNRLPTIKDAVVYTRTKHQCISCGRMVPPKNYMRYITFRYHPPFTVYVCRVCNEQEAHNLPEVKIK